MKKTGWKGIALTLCLCAFPAERLYQTGNEVLHSLRTANKHKEESECPDSPIPDAEHKGLLIGHALVRTLREADSVKGKSVARKDSLLFGEEFGRDGWVVREEEPDDDAGKTRYGTLDELV